jgi:hypothetical protein
MAPPNYFELLKDFPLPTYPFPSVISPFEVRIREEVNSWLDNEYTFLSEEVREKYKRYDFGSSVAHALPYVKEYHLMLPCARYMLSGFVLDDCLEHNSFQEMDIVRERIVAILNGTQHISPQDNALYREVAKLRDELIHLPEEWYKRFIESINNTLRGIQDENIYKKDNQFPPLVHLRLIREQSVAVHPLSLLIILEQDGVMLPADVFDHPVMQYLRTLTARMLADQNDFVSLPKELTRGDKEIINIVLSIRHEENISLRDAYRKAMDFHYRDLADFITLQKSLPPFGIYQEAAETYVLYLTAIIQGISTWTTNNYRYSSGGYAEPTQGAADIILGRT